VVVGTLVSTRQRRPVSSPGFVQRSPGQQTLPVVPQGAPATAEGSADFAPADDDIPF